MADDSHESSSDPEESFTFGSFTVEDTKEFKRSYDGLPKPIPPKKSPITKELANKNGKGEAAAAVSPAAPGGIETGVGRLQLSRSATAVAASETTAAANACDTADKSPRRAHSPPPALPVPSPTEEVDQVSSTLRASASLSGQEAAVIVTVTPSAVVATAEEKSPPRVMSWAAVAAGAAKPTAAVAAAQLSKQPKPQAKTAARAPRPTTNPAVSVVGGDSGGVASSAAASGVTGARTKAAGAALPSSSPTATGTGVTSVTDATANGIASAGGARIRRQPAADAVAKVGISQAAGAGAGNAKTSGAAPAVAAAWRGASTTAAGGKGASQNGSSNNSSNSGDGDGDGCSRGGDEPVFVAPSSSISGLGSNGAGERSDGGCSREAAVVEAATAGVETDGDVPDKEKRGEEEAARAKAEAEAVAAQKATEAAAAAEKKWQSLVVLLGREDWASSVAAGGGLNTAGVELVHRGLVNTGNSCFRSVVLQALLACEPFMRVLFRAAPWLKDSTPAQTAFPTWAQLARFASAFEPPKPGAAAPLAPGSSGNSGSINGGGGAGGGAGGGWSAPVGRGRARYQGTLGASAPVLPDEAMARAFGAFRTANTGEQEDAQEFLAFFLDQLHEEIVKAKKDGIKRKSESMPGSPAPIAGAEPTGAAAVAGREDEWLEVGKGGAKAVVNAPDPQRRVADSSVVTGLFYGMFRSEVKKSGSAKSSVTLEPFHCLQLDLDPPAPSPSSPSSGSFNNNHSANNGDGLHPSSHSGPASGPGRGGGSGAWGGAGAATTAGGRGSVGGGGGGAWGAVPMPGAGATSLDEALAALFGGEAVAGVKGRRNLEVKASRTLTLEQAPKVLTLHLKQFSFHPEFGPRKLARRVRYPLELTIPSRLMSPSLQHVASTRGPLKYRLFTVVLHHGRSLHGGHYTALVRDARGEWRHFDDQLVSPETEGHALNPMSGHPYLLLYTRM